MRAVVPVFADAAGEGRRAGLGRHHDASAIQGALRRPAAAPSRSRPPLILGTGLAGAWLISRRLRRQTHGLGEGEITRMYEYYDAVLHAVREGLLLVDTEGRVQLVNDEARGCSAWTARPSVGRPVAELGFPESLTRTVLATDSRPDEIHLVDDARAGGQHRARPLAGPRGRHGRDPARPHRAAGGHRRARHGPRPGRVAALAEPRGGQPAAHGRVAGRDGPHRRRRSTSRPGSSRSPSCSPTGWWARCPTRSLAALLLGKTAQAAERGVRADHHRRTPT